MVHACCIVCAINLIDNLRQLGFEPLAYYYNPNIHPKAEYDQRLRSFQKYFFGKIETLVGNWEVKKYFNKVKKTQNRCCFCYELRLENTFQMAKLLNINAVTTTLLVSKLQQKEQILKIAKRLSKKYNIKFISNNFDELFESSIKKAQKEKVYVQSYCGCIYSLMEKYEEKYQLSLRGTR